MYKILIVDDNPLIRMGLMNMIQWDRFNARLCGEADNGSKAMEMVEKHQPNLVITDIKMPQKDGLYLLNEISQNYPHISTIVVSAYDEFEYAKQAICSGSLNYILKPIKAKELNDTIKKAYDEFEQQQFNKLDKDTSVLHKNLMNEIASKYASSIVNIATIVFSFHCELSKMPTVSQVIALIETELHYTLMRKDNLYILVLLSERELHIEKLQNLYHQLLHKIKALNDQETLFGMSLPCKSDQFEMSYEHARQACALTIFYECDHLVYENLPKEDPLIGNLDPYEEEIKLYVVSGNYDKASEVIDKVKEALTQVGTRNHHILLTGLVELLKILFTINKKYMDPIRAIIVKIENQTTNLSFYSLAAIYKEIDSVIKDMTQDYMRNARDKSDLIYRIKELIKSNYGSEISLNYIAELFFVTPSYLSRLFKEESGGNINTYITEIRMIAAKKMLENTNEKVGTIGSKVGYNDPIYFAKVFKKHTGLSPNQYRQKG